MNNEYLDLELVKAYHFAALCHRGQMRESIQSGEAYINHPIDVAQLLAEAGFPKPVVIAGIFHDILEDCPDADKNAVYIQHHWPESYPLVKAMTKTAPPLGMTKAEIRVEKKRLLVIYYLGLRAILFGVEVKIADRICNLRDMVRMLRQQPHHKANRRWAESYIRRTKEEIDPLRVDCKNEYLNREYDSIRHGLMVLTGEISDNEYERA
jgi:guanosine-3',5'-bis(diphosphate) 3'-pyrophosphohydrolase